MRSYSDMSVSELHGRIGEGDKSAATELDKRQSRQARREMKSVDDAAEAMAIAESKRPEWQAYVGPTQIAPGDSLYYHPGPGKGRKVKFLSVAPDGLSLICGFECNPVEILPVAGFNGVTVKRPAGTIDLTPTWTAILPLLIEGLQNGTPEGKRLAHLELINMAKAADRYNASVPK